MKTEKQKSNSTGGSALTAELPGITLPKKKVTIKFYGKESAMVKDPSHILYGRLGPRAKKSFQLPMRPTGGWHNLFEDEPEGMQQYLETQLNLQEGWLSPNSRRECFFDSFFVSLSKEDTVFNLSNPDDYLKFLLIKSQKDFVAPSKQEIGNLNTYMWYIEDEEVEVTRKRQIGDKTARAYKILGNIEDNPSKMRQILIEKQGRSNLPNKANDPDWLYTKMLEMIEENIDQFITIANDPNLPIKVDIYDAVKASLIIQKGRFFYNVDESPIMAPGYQNDISGVIAFYSLPENSDHYATLKQQIKNAK